MLDELTKDVQAVDAEIANHVESARVEDIKLRVLARFGKDPEKLASALAETALEAQKRTTEVSPFVRFVPDENRSAGSAKMMYGSLVFGFVVKNGEIEEEHVTNSADARCLKTAWAQYGNKAAIWLQSDDSRRAFIIGRAMGRAEGNAGGQDPMAEAALLTRESVEDLGAAGSVLARDAGAIAEFDRQLAAAKGDRTKVKIRRPFLRRNVVRILEPSILEQMNLRNVAGSRPVTQ